MSGALFPRIREDAAAGIDGVLDYVEELFPLNERRRTELNAEIRALSSSLTDSRSSREDGYLGKPGTLAAYLRYYLPWNLYRLARLLPSLPLGLSEGDAVVDLGSGPLTVPIALWLFRPELRPLSLDFRCLDRTGAALEAGETLFRAVSGEAGAAWRIRRIRGSLGTRIVGPPAALVVAANVLNELFWSDRAPLDEQARHQASRLVALAGAEGRILVVEPGIPRSGEFLASLRGALLERGVGPIAPCPHGGACPMSGGRGRKWCHFSFGTEGAPARLVRLSEASRLPKDRAVLSFLLAGPAKGAVPGLLDGPGGGTAGPATSRIQGPVRIVSDAFPLPLGSWGRYGCSSSGLVLVRGSRDDLESRPSGALLEEEESPAKTARFPRDPKSGALVLDLHREGDSAPTGTLPPRRNGESPSSFARGSAKTGRPRRGQTKTPPNRRGR